MMLPAKIRHFLTLPSFFAFFFIILSFLNLGFCVDQQYISCAAQSCGTVKDIHYPFYLSNISQANCGYPGFNLTCANSSLLLYVPPPTNLYLTVLSIDYINRNFTVSLDSSQIATSNDCAYIKQGLNYPLSESLSFPYSTTSSDEKATFYYNCTTPPTFTSSSTGDTSYTGGSSGGGYDISKNIACSILNGSTGGDRLYSYVFYGDSMPTRIQMNCNSTMTVPVLESAAVNPGGLFSQYQQSLSAGFGLGWSFKSGGFNCSSCEFSGGRCGYNTSSSTSLCLCQDHPHTGTCRDPDSGTIMQKHGGVIIGSTVAAAAVLFLFFGACFIARRRYQAKHTRSVTESSYTESSFNTTSKSSSKFDLESISFRQRFRSVTIFTYKELEEATKNFDPANEVGDGGFGAVYFGKLKDGRKVAVKRLYENNFKRVAQFMNEIEILSNIRHPNLVCLYGCTSRHSRELLLVYEYVPNGTISDHIHGSRAATKPLSWKIRLSIAHQTAEALAYLHKLDPPIVHRDVKSTNILLENDYHVKVADFGLSRLFPMDVTHVSTAPAGTPGYVDPDYHKCYQLTDKSDVYSFGVVLCELISSLPAVDIRRHRHEINLANLAINKINKHALHEFVDKSLGYETDEWVKVTVRAVAELTFRCLATEKEIRPTMAETAECLKEILTGCHRDKSLVAPSPTEEDGALLKRSSSPLSPNSVTDKWLSMATTPNSSG